MVRYEIKKLLSNASLIGLICALALANCALMAYSLSQQGEDYYSKRELAAVYHEIEGMDAEDQAEYISGKLAQLQEEYVKDTLSDAVSEGESVADSGESIADSGESVADSGESVADSCESAGAEETVEEINFLDFYANYSRYSYVLNHINESIAYPEYLEQVREERTALAGSSLLSQPDSFSERNSALTEAMYAALESRELAAGDSTAIDLLTGWRLTDICLLVSILALLFKATAEEKKDGYYALLRTKPRGGTTLFAAKIAAVVTMLFPLYLLYYGSEILTLIFTVGFCDFGLPVQSLKSLYTCPYAITVGEYLGLFFLIKFLAYLAATLCMLFLCTISMGYALGCTLSVAVAAVSLGMYSGINRYSVLGIWKEANLAAVLDVGHYFTDAPYCNLAGNPVRIAAVGAVAGMVYGICGAVLALVCWNHPVKKLTENSRCPLTVKAVMLRGKHLDARKQTENQNAGEEKEKKGKKKFGWSISKRYQVHLLPHEFHKLVSVCHVFPILLVLAAVLLWMHDSLPGRFVQSEDAYYDYYSSALAGELTDAKAQYLLEEEERLNTAEERIAEYEAQYEQGQLSEEARDYYISQEEISDEQMNGFMRAKQQYEKLEALQDSQIMQESEVLQESEVMQESEALQELQVSQGSQESTILPIYYLNESGWEYLCGEKFTQQRYLDILLLLMALLLIFSGYVSMEYQTGMNVLHESAPDGAGKVMLAKTIVAAVTGAVAAVLVYLIEMVFVIRGWGLDGWNRAAVSVQSITVLGAAVDCSIRQWMVLQGIGWMICGVFAAEIITFLSRLLKRQVVAMLAGFLVLGLPVLVMLLV